MVKKTAFVVGVAKYHEGNVDKLIEKISKRLPTQQNFYNMAKQTDILVSKEAFDVVNKILQNELGLLHNKLLINKRQIKDLAQEQKVIKGKVSSIYTSLRKLKIITKN